MTKSGFYKFILRLMIIIFSAFAIFCSENILSVLIEVVSVIFIYKFILSVFGFIIKTSLFDEKGDFYRFEMKIKKVFASIFSILILGNFTFMEITDIFDFLNHNIHHDIIYIVIRALFISVGLTLLNFVCHDSNEIL